MVSSRTLRLSTMYLMVSLPQRKTEQPDGHRRQKLPKVYPESEPGELPN